jgi:hypothetical protein
MALLANCKTNHELMFFEKWALGSKGVWLFFSYRKKEKRTAGKMTSKLSELLSESMDNYCTFRMDASKTLRYIEYKVLQNVVYYRAEFRF